VNEAPVLPAEEARDEVDRSQSCPDQQTLAREAEDEVVARALGGRADERVVVRVAANDAMHDHGVGRLDALAVLGHVGDTEFGPLVDARLAPKLQGRLLIGRRQLDVHGRGGPGPQELGLDGAHAAADLEDGRALEPSFPQEVDHQPGRLVQALPPVSLRVTAGRPLTEQLLVPARRRAAAHPARMRASSAL
jgi:hypothetical protein